MKLRVRMLSVSYRYETELATNLCFIHIENIYEHRTDSISIIDIQ